MKLELSNCCQSRVVTLEKGKDKYYRCVKCKEDCDLYETRKQKKKKEVKLSVGDVAIVERILELHKAYGGDSVLVLAHVTNEKAL